MRALLQTYEYLVDFALLLEIRDSLDTSLLSLLRMEVEESVKNKTLTELFRADSASMRLASAVFNFDNVVRYRFDFTSHVAGYVLKHLSITTKSTLKIAQSTLKELNDSVKSMPEELILLLNVVLDVQETSKIPHLAGSFLFLRFVCPSITQPDVVGGLDTPSESQLKSMVQTAKALQLVANRCDPMEDSFLAPIKEDLRALYPAVDALFEKVRARRSSSVRTLSMITEQLLEPCLHVSQCVGQLAMPNEAAAITLARLKASGLIVPPTVVAVASPLNSQRANGAQSDEEVL